MTPRPRSRPPLILLVAIAAGACGRTPPRASLQIRVSGASPAPGEVAFVVLAPPNDSSVYGPKGERSCSGQIVPFDGSGVATFQLQEKGRYMAQWRGSEPVAFEWKGEGQLSIELPSSSKCDSSLVVWRGRPSPDSVWNLRWRRAGRWHAPRTAAAATLPEVVRDLWKEQGEFRDGSEPRSDCLLLERPASEQETAAILKSIRSLTRTCQLPDGCPPVACPMFHVEVRDAASLDGLGLPRSASSSSP